MCIRDSNTWNIAPRGDDQFTIRDLFASGKLAFMLAGNWMPGNLALADVTCNWGYAAHPYFEGGKAVTATGCWNIGCLLYTSGVRNIVKPNYRNVIWNPVSYFFQGFYCANRNRIIVGKSTRGQLGLKFLKCFL